AKFRGAGARGARPRGHGGSTGVAAGRAVGRAEAAGGHRPRAVFAPQAAPGRRAHRQPRLGDGAADHRAVPEAQPRRADADRGDARGAGVARGRTGAQAGRRAAGGMIASLIWQNLKRTRRELFFSVFGIAVGISSLVFFLALAEGVRTAVLSRV